MPTSSSSARPALTAVVGGYALEDTAEFRTAPVIYVKNSPQHGFALSVGQLPDNGITALLFDRHQKHSFVLMSANRVCLPIAKLDVLRNNADTQFYAAAENTLVHTYFAASARIFRVSYS